MRKTVIISGGNIDYDFALSFLEKEEFDYVIGADHGLAFLRKSGIVPDEIVGDFDSASMDELEYFRERGDVPIRVFQPEKDFTDTQIALELAMERDSTSICILGGTGTRLDHVMGNLQVLSLPLEKGIPCALVDKHNRIHLHDKPLSIEREGQYGKYVSLFAFGGEVRGVTLEGFFYPLKDYTLSPFEALGVSNEITEPVGRIGFSSGKLLVVESMD